MSTPAARSPRGSGPRRRMTPAQREAWGERLADSAVAVQRAAALERDIDGALNDNCHLRWISATTGVHFAVIRRIRDEGVARSWRHPQRWEPFPRRNDSADIIANEGIEDSAVTFPHPSGDATRGRSGTVANSMDRLDGHLRAEEGVQE